MTESYLPHGTNEHLQLIERFRSFCRDSAPEGYVPSSHLLEAQPLHHVKGEPWFERELRNNPETVFVNFHPQTDAMRRDWVKPYVPETAGLEHRTDESAFSQERLELPAARELSDTGKALVRTLEKVHSLRER